MPPKTRTNKAVKALKENECPIKSNKLHKPNKEARTRKPLADKTNSASDDNASLLVEEIPLKVTPNKNNHDKNGERPRRARRLPNRYKENNTLKNLSSNDVTPPNQDILKSKNTSTNKQPLSPVKTVVLPAKKPVVPEVVISPFKSPKNNLNNSILKKRPKRICRLPSKFDDHSISPNKFIPLQPINASTPLANKTKQVCEKPVLKTSVAKKATPPTKVINEPSKQKTLKDFFNNSNRSDTNNNAKTNKKKDQIISKKSPLKTKQTAPKLTEKSFSIRILDDNKKSRKRDSSKLDVYEFTYDPEEEPPPAKKKKKKTTKKPSKPKTVTVKSNYDKNLAKALATLKNTVSKPDKLAQENPTAIPPTNAISSNTKTTELNINTLKETSMICEKNYNSVRVEDIAMDMQADEVSIDYSPVNSPNRPATPQRDSPKAPSNDPLNLQENISFFDELPAASSSMNVSVRHPTASPWRVEFNNLPIKWQANTYVKPNMTPAVESSFVNSNDSNKKHVYTNMVAEANESLPEVIEAPSLRQTSIMSFIKEVIDKNASRKSKVKSTPVKANSLFEDVSNASIVVNIHKQALSRSDPKMATPQKNSSHEKSNNSSNISTEINNSDNQENNLENSTTPKNKNKEKDKNITYFGFDSEDQENISPKKKNKARSLRSKTRGILQELNNQKGPMRAVLPVTAKSKPLQSDVDKIFDGVKSATEPPVFPEIESNTVQKEKEEQIKATEVTSLENDDDDGESVHLFEDIEVVHHHKPTRKSYSKPVKKVAFNKPAMDSDSTSDVERASSDEDLEDLSFKLPSEKPKKTIKRKKTNKQKLSKKEEKEVEAWAAGFNSMCEDIDEFDLVVE